MSVSLVYTCFISVGKGGFRDAGEPSYQDRSLLHSLTALPAQVPRGCRSMITSTRWSRDGGLFILASPETVLVIPGGSRTCTDVMHDMTPDIYETEGEGNPNPPCISISN